MYIADERIICWFEQIYKKVINKSNPNQTQMMRANCQLLPDRHLFNNLHKHHHISEIYCQPHIPLPNTNTKGQPITKSNINHHHNDNIIKQSDRLFQQISTMEEVLSNRIDRLENRVNDINRFVNRIHAVIKLRKSRQLYSFANSPNSKNNSNEEYQAEGERREYTRSNVPASAQKYKYDSQYKYDEGYIGSTQPKTKHKQPDSQHPQQPYIQPHPTSNTTTNTYFTKNIQTLHNEIQHLKSYIEQTHPVPTQPYMPSTSKLSQSVSKYQQQIKPTEFDDRISLTNTVERYRAIMLQYQKQENIMRDKIGRYRDSLYEVLNWLKNMREAELPAYLPCQHCHLRTIITQYLQPNNPKIRTTINIEQTSTKNRQKPSLHKTKFSHGELSQLVNNYQDLYEELQSMRPATEINENLSEQDSLLMEYDVDSSDGDS